MKEEFSLANNITTIPFTPILMEFIQTTTWTYAKTMPEWPHEYIVKNQVDQELFNEMVRHIRKFGYEGDFYNKKMTYYDEDDLTYWTKGATIDKTTIINRCKWKKQTC